MSEDPLGKVQRDKERASRRNNEELARKRSKRIKGPGPVRCHGYVGGRVPKTHVKNRKGVFSMAGIVGP